jgi:AAA+ superfamily predicted ATPase
MRLTGESDAHAQPFAGAYDHLLAELERLRYLLHAEIARMRASNLLNEDQFRGLYISDQQVDAVLDMGSSTGDRIEAGEVQSEIAALHARAHHIEAVISARCAASSAEDMWLPLEQLISLYDLSPFECDALLMAVAAEIDPAFETLYSYVQNDVTRKRPSVGLAVRLLAPPGGLIEARNVFSASGRLIQIPILRLIEEEPNREPALLSRAFRPEERIVDLLLGEDELDSRIRGFTVRLEPSRLLSALHLAVDLAESLRLAGTAMLERPGILFFCGAAGTGKSAAAEALTAEAGRLLVAADLRLAQASGMSPPAVLGLLSREARLSNSNLLLAHADAWLLEEDAHRRAPYPAIFRSLSKAAEACGTTVFITSEMPWPAAQIAFPNTSASFEFPLPAFSHRCALWREGFDSIGATLPAGSAAELANRFVLSGGQILRACRAAAAHAALRGRDSASLDLLEFAAQARAQSNQGLNQRAQKIERLCDWTQLVLPGRAIRQLREVCAAERHRSTVYVDWGFDRRMMQGKGTNVMFCGPSGTGKTMSAGIIARDLGLDLYKIDLSTVVSKYIGETEKQLSQIFREAQSSNAILFFDEADAIFGKRSEVKDAHDRYANIEVAYLLQKMEEYEGIVILATNFRRNIDEAFTRRIHYIIEFPFPEPEYRERIWRNMIPPGAPLHPDVDFGFLARQFELAGGNIRNAVLAAAFYAAEEGGDLRMDHFVLAVARELQKMGKLPSRSEFREYYELACERG